MKPIDTERDTSLATRSFLDGLFDVLIQSYESYAMK